MPLEDPVTLSVTRLVREDRVQDFEQWILGITAAARGFVGQLGVGILRPPPGQALEYTLVMRFDSDASFRRWQESPERQEWLERAEPLLEGRPVENVIPGLEFWFTPPASKVLRQPPRWKMTLLTLLALYPVSLLSNVLLSPVLEGWPLGLRVLAVSCLIVPTMTYLVMPRVTRGFAGWLSSSPRSSR